MKNELRINLILSFQNALLGMIYPSIRGICVKVIDNLLIVKCYLDRDPMEYDFEHLSEITTEVLADIDFENVKEFCEFSEETIDKLDSLDMWIYLRKETSFLS